MLLHGAANSTHDSVRSAKKRQRFETLRLLWRCDSVCRNDLGGIQLVQNKLPRFSAAESVKRSPWPVSICLHH